MRSKFKWIFALLLAFTIQFSFAQEKTVSGVITEGGLPLPGVNVVVKGTSRGVQSDFDGKYAIKAKSGDILEFTFLSMKNQTVTVGALNTVNVKMELEAESLVEVEVTGALGIKRKADAITSSYQVVKATELTQANNPNVIQSLTGKVSGLQINQTNNGVDGTSRIVLRGSRSITGNNQALIVIDNVISSATVLQQLPPSIVDNVNVIKGMQGAALYGEQGVNGVIIVTTKRGNGNEKLTVNVNSSIDFEKIYLLPKRQTKYGQGWDGDFDNGENSGWGPLLDGSIRPTGLPQANGEVLMLPYSPIKDNIKPFFNTGTIKQNGFTLNAGGESGYALLTVNKQNSEYVVQGDALDRTSVLFKAGRKVGRFSIDGNVNYISQKTQTTDSNLYQRLMMTASNIPVQMFSNPSNANHWTYFYSSPYWIRENDRRESRSDFVNGIATLGYEINKNINITYVANIQVRQTGFESHVNGYKDELTAADYQFAEGTQSIVSEYASNNSSTRNFYGDLLVNFNYMLSDDLSLKFNIGNNIQDNYFKVTSVGGTNLDIPGFYNITNVLQPSLPSDLDNRTVRSRKFSVLANADLGYKDYLYLNLTARNDWTSVLHAPGKKDNYFYPSAGLSFIPTKAFEGLQGSVLSYAKISASFVKVGNTSAVAPYAINEIGVFPAGYPFGSLSSYILNQTPTSKQIKPEFITTKEATLNLGFFNDRITLDASYYRTDTKDLITNVTASSASGLANSRLNIGAMKTTGYDIDLGFTPIKTKDFKWENRVSYSTNKSIVTRITDDTNEVNLGGTSNVGIFAAVGEQFPLIKGTAYMRDPEGNVIINPNTGTPRVSSTFQKLGKSTPDYILGFNTAVEYKGLRLSAVMDYRTGHQFYSGTKQELAYHGHLLESADFDRDNGGFIYPNSVIQTAPGVYTQNTTVLTGGTSYPSVASYYSRQYTTVGENFVLDASAFKVRELALSYSLPTELIKNSGLTAVRFGINARNPFTVLAKDNKNYNDPETSNTSGNAQGLAAAGQYPSTRTFGFSMNLTF